MILERLFRELKFYVNFLNEKQWKESITLLPRVLSHRFHLPEEGSVVIADPLSCWQVISPN